MSAGMVDIFAAGLLSTFQKYAAVKDMGSDIPDKAEISQSIAEALKTVDYNNRAETAMAVKVALDRLADNMMSKDKGGNGP